MPIPRRVKARSNRGRSCDLHHCTQVVWLATEVALLEPCTRLEMAGTELRAGALCTSVAGNPEVALTAGFAASLRTPAPANPEVVGSTCLGAVWTLEPWRRVKRAAGTASCCTTEAALPEPRTWLEVAGTEPLAGALCASVAGNPEMALSDVLRAPVPANTEVGCSTSPEAA